jgi:hypothetical protein
MTRRITISLPDDVAQYAEQAGPNTSGFIAGVLRRKMRADGLRERWAAAGYVVTDKDVERVRTYLETRVPISDEAHDRNVRWLAQFDNDQASAT